MHGETVELTTILGALQRAVQRVGQTVAGTVGSVDLDEGSGAVDVWLRRGSPALKRELTRELRRLPGVRCVRIESAAAGDGRSGERS